jgi:hypothetical protein
MGVVGVIAVSAQKDHLAHMVKDENLSSIEVMSDEVGVSQDEVRTMLRELLEQGVLKGRITEDGMRFFQDGVRVSEHPSIPTKEEEPEFMKFNTRPGRYAAEAGLAVVVISYLTMAIFGGNMDVENVAVGMIFVGFLLMAAGCYYVGRRKTPL